MSLIVLDKTSVVANTDTNMDKEHWYIMEGSNKNSDDENSIKLTRYEDTTKLYEIINYYTNDEVLTIEVSHDVETESSKPVDSTPPSLLAQNEATAADETRKDKPTENEEDWNRIHLVGDPADILGQIYDDQTGILYNIYRYRILNL